MTWEPGSFVHIVTLTSKMKRDRLTKITDNKVMKRYGSECYCSYETRRANAL